MLNVAEYFLGNKIKSNSRNVQYFMQNNTFNLKVKVVLLITFKIYRPQK